MKKIKAGIFFLILVLVFGLTDKVSADAVFKFGVLVPASGPFAEMSDDAQNGIKLAKDLYPEVPVDFVYADSKADQNTAISEYRKLTTHDKVNFIYVIRSGVGLVINPLSKADKIPIIGGVAHEDFLTTNPYAFRGWPPALDEGRFMAEEIANSRVKKVAVVSASDDYMLNVEKGFKERAASRGLKIEPHYEFLPADTDFRAAFPKIRSSGTEAVFANLTMANLGIFIKQYRESGITKPLYASFFVNRQDTAATAGLEAVKGIKFVEPTSDYPQAQKILAEKYGETDFNTVVISMYASIVLGFQAIADNPGIKTTAELYDAMGKVTSLRLHDKTLEVKNREILFPMHVATVN